MKMRSALTAATLVVLAGCSTNGQHGKYTAAHKSAAAAKMDGMKAAMEWQTANQAFLGGDLKKALKHVRISLDHNDQVVKSHVLLGRILMEQGEIEPAIQAFERAQALDPRAVDPHYYAGLLYERCGQKENALKEYRQAAELDPEDPQYALAAAELMIDLRQLPEARAFLETRRDSFRHNAGVRQTLGHIAMIDGRYPEAVEHFRQARLLAPDDVAILEDLARAQMEVGDFAGAESSLTRLLATNEHKGRRDLMLLQATCFCKLQRHVDARALLLTLTRDKNAAADVETWIALGNVSYVLNDTVRLRQAAARVIAMAPTRSEGYMLRALQLKQAQEWTGAEAAAAKAVSVQPTAEGYLLLGQIQQKLGKNTAASKSFAMARQLDLDTPTTATAGVEDAPESDK